MLTTAADYRRAAQHTLAAKGYVQNFARAA